MAKTDFERLSEIVVGEFARVHARFDTLDDRFDAVETRQRQTNEQLSGIVTDLRDIRSRAESLEEAVSNLSGFSKEIDHLLRRVSVIEKHLGLQSAIEA